MSHSWMLAVGTLAQADKAQNEMVSALSWGLGIIGVVVIGGALVMLYRRNLTSKEAPEDAVGFGLSDLRAMRDRGDLTNEEFEAAREKMAAKMKEKVGMAEGELTLRRIGEMLDKGELTAEQYQVERKKIIERLKGKTS